MMLSNRRSSQLGLVSPAWTRSTMGKPQGIESKGAYTIKAYTREQQGRLDVDKRGMTPISSSRPTTTTTTTSHIASHTTTTSHTASHTTSRTASHTPCVANTVGLPVGWRPLTNEGKQAVAKAFHAGQHAHSRTHDGADLVVLIGAAWYAANKDADAGAAWTGLIPNGKEFSGAKQKLSTLPTSYPPSMGFLKGGRNSQPPHVVAPRVFKAGGVEWKPSWCVGLAAARGITDLVGDLGSGKFSVCDAVTGTQLSRHDVDRSNPAATAVVIRQAAASHPGIKIFATGKWRETGLEGLDCADCDCDLSVLSQEDEGKYAGLCTAVLMDKIYQLDKGTTVTVLESGGGSTQITTVVM